MALKYPSTPWGMSDSLNTLIGFQSITLDISPLFFLNCIVIAPLYHVNEPPFQVLLYKGQKL